MSKVESTPGDRAALAGKIFDAAKRIIEVIPCLEPSEQDCAIAMAVEIIKADRVRLQDLAMTKMSNGFQELSAVHGHGYPERKSPTWVREELEN